MSLMVGDDIAVAVLPAVGELLPQSNARSSTERCRTSEGFGILRTLWHLGRCGSGGTGNTGRDEEEVETVLDVVDRDRPDRGGTVLPYRRPREPVSMCRGEDTRPTDVVVVDLTGAGLGGTNVPLVLMEGDFETATGPLEAADAPLPFWDWGGEDDISLF